MPTGNFGNVLAGWMAAENGRFRTPRFRVATNQNDILYRLFTTGEYRIGDVRPSLAPSMDIQVASNFERFLFYLLDENPEQVRGTMRRFHDTGRLLIDPLPAGTFRASRMDDPEIRTTIARVWKDHGCLVDPHTACGLGAIARDRASVILSTAHPAKFPDVVKAATGIEPTHPSLDVLKTRPLRTFPLPATPDAVKTFIERHIRAGAAPPAGPG